MRYEHCISSLHVIDSTKEGDDEPGLQLAARLNSELKAFSGLPIHVHPVLDRAELQKVLEKIFGDEASKGTAPVLHFEAHGSDSGISLRDGSEISWDEFSLVLAPFNVATKFNFLVVLSCCQGFQQIHSINYSRVCPFSGLVSCTGIANTEELLDGFETLYRCLGAQVPIDEAVKKMNKGLTKGSKIEFGLETAVRMFRGVIEMIYRDNLNPNYLSEQKEEIRRKMERDAALEGSLSPISREKVERAFQDSLEKEVRKFHRNYFALAAVPENATVYSFESMVTDVRRLVESGQ